MSKASWKRKKWLLKNLKFHQLIKYIFIKKPEVTADDSDISEIVAYDVDYNTETDDNATLLIKPSGVKKVNEIIKELEKYNVNIVKSVDIYNYTKYAKTVFYMVKAEEQGVWEKVLKTYFPDTCNRAILLYLDKSIEDIADIKTRIRKKMGIDFYKIKKKSGSYITSITMIHSSNKEERVYEESTIKKMLADGCAVYGSYN